MDQDFEKFMLLNSVLDDVYEFAVQSQSVKELPSDVKIGFLLAADFFHERSYYWKLIASGKSEEEAHDIVAHNRAEQKAQLMKEKNKRNKRNKQ